MRVVARSSAPTCSSTRSGAPSSTDLYVERKIANAALNPGHSRALRQKSLEAGKGGQGPRKETGTV